MVGFVENDNIEMAAFDIGKDFFLFGEIDGDDAECDVIEGVGAEFRFVLDFLEGRRIQLSKSEPEPLAHFAFPLMEERSGRTNDKHAVSAASGDQFGEDEASFDGFSEADVIGEQKARPRHGEGAHDGDELVRFDAESSGLSGEQGVGTEGLFEQERVVVHAKGGEVGSADGVEFGGDGFDGVVWGRDEVELVAAQAFSEASQAVEGRFATRFDEDDFPV